MFKESVIWTAHNSRTQYAQNAPKDSSSMRKTDAKQSIPSADILMKKAKYAVIAILDMYFWTITVLWVLKIIFVLSGKKEFV